MPAPPTKRRTPGAAVTVLLSLVAGIAVGALIQSMATPGFARAAGNIEMIGTLWINSIRMTVIPLVAALTISSVATSGDAARVGRVGGYAVVVFVVILLAGGFFAMLTAPIAMASLTIPVDVAERLRESVGGAIAAAPPAMPSLAQRIVDIVPVNPIKAAADGTLLPVVVFSVALGLALSRVAAEKREPFVEVCRAISDALIVLVKWILVAAPIGVFALALGLGAKMGASSAGALLHYIVVICAVLFAFTVLVYPFVMIAGRASPRRFASAVLPAQAVAFTTRSSLAAFPAVIAGARNVLGLGPTETGFTLPLAVSVFRPNVPIAWVVGFLFLGTLYGVPVGTPALAMLVVTSTLISFSVPGIPSASLFLIAPVLMEYGIPAEGVGILIAVDAIPDMFKTLLNATSHLAGAVVVERVAGEAPSGSAIAQE
ncbi:MAG: dicarboxylate/amino acid:cation symporter [Gemmatimonadetes bacterium]|nr:dicarboxylate/amino acid:cation symporter [Gemmatimonadota bacterium]